MHSILCSVTVVDCHTSKVQDTMYLILGPIESQFLIYKC